MKLVKQRYIELGFHRGDGSYERHASILHTASEKQAVEEASADLLEEFPDAVDIKLVNQHPISPNEATKILRKEKRALRAERRWNKSRQKSEPEPEPARKQNLDEGRYGMGGKFK